MARVVLFFDPENRDAAVFGAFLIEKRHDVHVIYHAGDLDGHGRDHEPPDVIVVDVSLDRSVDWENLDAALHVAWVRPPRPMVLAVSDIYRGPQMQLRAERKGARFAWLL